MKSSHYPILLLLLCLPACLSDNIKTTERRTFFIQALVDSPLLTAIKEKVTQVIDEIIKEELSLAKEYDFDFFLPKKRQPQALTLYYLDNLDINGITLINSVLENISPPLLQPRNTAIRPQVNFFGDAGDEFVIMIDDPKEELSAINKEIKDAVHKANKEIKRQHGTELYDIAKSERYPFLPHMGIGRIRINSIKKHINDLNNADDIIGRIKERILNVAQSIAEELLASTNSIISFDAICLFDLEKRECIKSYELRN